MGSNISNQKETKTSVKEYKKKVKPTDKQKDKELISLRELKKRGGIIGIKDEYFKMYIRLYIGHHIYHPYTDTITGVAKYIADKKELYIQKGKCYKLIKLNSILTDLRRIHKQEEENLKTENELKESERKKWKSRYNK